MIALVSRRALVAGPARRGSRPDRLCTAVMLAVAAGTGGLLLLAGWLVIWLLVTSFLAFLIGPEATIGPERLPEPFLLLPPIALTTGSLLVLWWLVASGRLGWEWTAAGGDGQSADRAAVGLISRRWRALLLALGCLGYLAFARQVFLYHRIDGGIDNGMYLYAARLVMAGEVLYRDFHFNQNPLLPYILGVTLAPFGYSEAASRLFAIAGTLATLLVSALAAERLGGRLAGLLAFGLLVTNMDFVTELSAGVRTNGSITALLAALTALFLVQRRDGAALTVAALAAGVRLLFAPLPVLVAAYLALVRGRPRLALLGSVGLAVLIFGPFLLLGGESAVFGILSQAQRAEFMERWYGLAKGLRAHLISTRDGTIDVIAPYLVFYLTALPAVGVIWRKAHPRWDLLALLLISNVGLWLMNVLPYPVNPRYPVTQLPLLAVLNGVGLATVIEWLARRAAWDSARVLLLALVGLLLAGSPFLATRPPDFLEWYKYAPPVERLETVARYVRSLAGPSATILTLETPVANEAGLRVPRGLEAGSWAIVRGMSEEQARRLGVVTYDMLIAMVEQGQGDVLVESDRYGLRNFAANDAQKERMARALEQHYRLRETFPQVSDWGTVRVYTRKID